MQNASRPFILPWVRLLNSTKILFRNTGMSLGKARSRNRHSFVFVLLVQRFNAWPALANTSPLVEKYTARIVAAMVRKFYRAKNSILSQLNWMMNKTKLFWMMTALIFLLGCGLFAPGSSSTPDLLATLQASTPSSLSSPAVTDSIVTPVFDLPQPNPTFG